MADQLTENKVGAIAYVIYVDGELVETVTDDDPIEYLHGHGNIVDGLEEALAGLSTGDDFDVTLDPEKAYGEYSDDEIEAIPLADMDLDEEEGELEIGAELEMMDEEGEILEGVVVGFEDDAVIVDFNHPLAGKTVRYAGKVVDVRDATEEELEWGLPESLLDEYFDEDDFDDEDEHDHEH